MRFSLARSANWSSPQSSHRVVPVDTRGSRVFRPGHSASCSGCSSWEEEWALVSWNWAGCWWWRTCHTGQTWRCSHCSAPRDRWKRRTAVGVWNSGWGHCSSTSRNWLWNLRPNIFSWCLGYSRRVGSHRSSLSTVWSWSAGSCRSGSSLVS